MTGTKAPRLTRAEIDDQLLALGAVPKKRAAPEKEPAPDDYEIWPENKLALDLFLDASSQWRLAGMSGARVALDYAALEATARMCQVVMTRDLLHDVQAIEHGAVVVFAEVAAAEAKKAAQESKGRQL